MKRLLLLALGLAGLSFACDQPYEEITGIKIGCPVESSVDRKIYTQGDNLLGGDFIYKDVADTDFFNLKGLIIVNGNIEGITLRETRNPVSFESFKERVKRMESSWGKSTLIEDDRAYVVYFNQIPNQDVVNYVDSILVKEDGSMLVTYRTKKLQEAQQREEERVRRWSLEGIWKNSFQE